MPQYICKKFYFSRKINYFIFLQLCVSDTSSWQAVEGAIMGMTGVSEHILLLGFSNYQKIVGLIYAILRKKSFISTNYFSVETLFVMSDI